VDELSNVTPVLGRYFTRRWARGEGHRLYDDAGRGYLDFANGIAVTALGHQHAAVNAAIHAQVDRMIGPTGAIGSSEPVERLASMLAASLPDPIDSVMFLNSGSEAVEAALKLARRVTGRPAIICFRGAFHGRTFGAASVTSSNLNYRSGYEPLLPSVYMTRFPAVYREFGDDPELATRVCLDELEQLTKSIVPTTSVAAVLIEPVQGEGGYIPAPPAFLQGLRAFCDRNGILLIADEVQSGFGRTGRMWAFEEAGIVPDIVCVAKAIANGLPLSAIASSRALQERWGVGAHGSTFGGNPVSCAAGIAVLETIAAQGLVANAAARGAELTAQLRELAGQMPAIGDVRGPGLMIGVELVGDRATRAPDSARGDRVIAEAADRGLLLLTCGPAHNVVRWIPPLDVTTPELEEALGIFEAALAAS
jgi:4-aminobutyrate aminotransferase